MSTQQPVIRPPQTSLDGWPAPLPPYDLGDFAAVTGEKKWRLRWCPLRVLDPERPNHRFRGPMDDRAEHFLREHGPDDVGRPMAELLPELEGDAVDVE